MHRLKSLSSNFYLSRAISIARVIPGKETQGSRENDVVLGAVSGVVLGVIRGGKL